jgi:hypothetical protein
MTTTGLLALPRPRGTDGGPAGDPLAGEDPGAFVALVV